MRCEVWGRHNILRHLAWCLRQARLPVSRRTQGAELEFSRQNWDWGCTLWPSLTPRSLGAEGDLGQGFIIHTITYQNWGRVGRVWGKWQGFYPMFKLPGCINSHSVILGVSVAAFSSQGSVISVSGSRGTSSGIWRTVWGPWTIIF